MDYALPRTQRKKKQKKKKILASYPMAQINKKEYKIAFMPSGKRGSFPEGTTILDASRALGVDLDSVCGGRAICGRCQIELTEGKFAKHGIESKADHLSGVTNGAV